MAWFLRLDRARAWFLGLDWKKRILLIAACGLVLGAAIGLAVMGGNEAVNQLLPCDDSALAPGERIGDRPRSYGNKIADSYCRAQARFPFKYTKGRAVVSYMVAGCNQKQELDLKLNGRHVQFTPMTFDRFAGVISLNLPRNHLKPNEMNLLEFINTVNSADPSADEDWAVVVNSIVEQPPPKADVKKAEEAFENALEQIKNRGVAPGNLYRALHDFEQAEDYLELLPENTRPAMYAEASKQIQKIEDELNGIFQKQLFEAERTLQFQRKVETKEIYQVLMLTFPNEKDWRHQQARLNYINLGGIVQDINP